MASPTGELVSVVIASYNMGQYLPRAVQSALAQSYPQVEVLVVDDGSTDDTPAIMRQFDGEARVRAMRQPNGGQADDDAVLSPLPPLPPRAPRRSQRDEPDPRGRDRAAHDDQGDADW